jgi:hypothetical protein
MRVEAPFIPTTAVSGERTVWLSGEFTTFLNKLLFPVVWLALISGFFISAIIKNGRISVASDFRFLLVVILIATAFMLWFSLRLQRVGYCGKELVISSYWREARIPFDQVEAVEPVWWYRGRVVRIQLRSESPFGDAVYYLPKWGFVRCIWSSPDRELRELIKSRAGAGTTTRS